MGSRDDEICRAQVQRLRMIPTKPCRQVPAVRTGLRESESAIMRPQDCHDGGEDDRLISVTMEQACVFGKGKVVACSLELLLPCCLLHSSPASPHLNFQGPAGGRPT